MKHKTSLIPMNLQTFAAGENNNQAVRSYQKQFKELLQAVYQKQAYFREFFGGGVEALDGVTHNKTAFSIKTSDIPVVIGTEYNKGANVAFGTGTSSSTRFGERQEIIYTDTDVPYDWEWVFHEGIDRHTVNNDFAATIADRAELQAQAKVQLFDNKGGEFISKIADQSLILETMSNEAVLRLFNQLSNAYVNMEAVGTKMAWVKPELYNAIVDHPITTTAKRSGANVDDNAIIRFKGFQIKEVPETKFQEGELAYTSIIGVGKQFTGINTSRTIESEDFDGVAFQGAGKAGEYILPANKKAVIKVVDGTVGEDQAS
ncbi:phage capsid protein [Alkalicoccobacillus porphyridii]|nr:phage capsid protein [Alkalicoccobacillus porphyridii]